jgi:glycosyltransferase involved in cell wall biosynthesis
VTVGAAAGITDEKVKFLLAGDGPEFERITRRVEREGIRRVILPGYVADTTTLYNKADVLVNASMNEAEATSFSLLEGMGLGIPAAVSDTGGNPYVIEDEVNGLLFPDGDAGALRAALTRLRNDGALYARLREGARRVYRERFTVSGMVGQMEALYRELLQEK